MAEPLILVEHLSHAYEEGTPAIFDISLEIPDNAFLVLVGHNGAGKTTLVKHLNGLLKPTSGKVIVAGMDTRSTTTAVLARQVGFVFQNPDHQIFSGTVEEEVAFGLKNLGFRGQELDDSTHRALDALALLPYRNVPPAMLGYGLRRKVTLATVLAMNPRILVLDEPAVGLDAHSSEEFFGLVQRMHQEGHTIILVTHDMRLAVRYSSSCAVLNQGRLVGYGHTRSIFSQVNLLEKAGLAQPTITRLGRALQDIGMPADVLSVQEFADAYLRLSEAS